ncbi:MAG: hypothetical protein ACRCTU_01045, partial [Zoogloea sp.]
MSWVSASYKKDTSAFKCQVGLVWLGLLGLFGVFVGHFDLDFLVIREKLEPLLGLELNAEEQLQGVPLTVLVSIGAMALAVLFGLAAALGKLSSNPLAFGLA